jgi:hypothetical protein
MRLEQRGVPVRELNLVEHRGELQRPTPTLRSQRDCLWGAWW